MYIIDKNKDYYDHYSHLYGVDKNIVFDRRGSVLINNDNLVLQPENRFFRDETQYILLETGMVQYLIKIDDIKYRKAPHKTLKDSFNLVFDFAKFEIVKKFENYKNIFGKAISIHSVYNDWFSYLDYVCGTKSKKIDYLNYRVTDEISIDLQNSSKKDARSLAESYELLLTLVFNIMFQRFFRDFTNCRGKITTSP
jgi:hypothetical protein